MNYKTLTKFNVFCLVLGSIIGWGSFTLPSSRFLDSSGIINTAIGFFIGGLIMIIIQNSYHIMLKGHTKDGGEFSYTYEKLGRAHGFIVGWSLALCYISLVPLNATAFNLIISKVLQIETQYLLIYTIGDSPVYLSEIILSSVILILFTAINIRGLKLSALIQNILVILLVVNVCLIFTFYLIQVDATPLEENYITNYEFSFPQILKVLAIAPFAFVGFDVIPQVTTNLKFNQSKATAIAILTIFIGVGLYILLNTITAFDYHLYRDADWPLASSIFERMGDFGRILLLLAVLGAIIGGINGFMISGSKLIASLSEFKLMRFNYAVQNQFGANDKSILFILIVSLIAPWFGRSIIIYIVEMSAVLASIAYLYVCIIGIRHADSKFEKSLAIIGTAFSIIFIILLLTPGSPAFLSNFALIFLLIWTLLGCLTYFKNRIKNV